MPAGQGWLTEGKEVQAALDTNTYAEGRKFGVHHCYSRRLDHHCKVYAPNTMAGSSQRIRREMNVCVWNYRTVDQALPAFLTRTSLQLPHNSHIPSPTALDTVIFCLHLTFSIPQVLHLLSQHLLTATLTTMNSNSFQDVFMAKWTDSKKGYILDFNTCTSYVAHAVLYKHTDESCVEVKISSKGAVTVDPHPTTWGTFLGLSRPRSDDPQSLHTHTHTHTHTHSANSCILYTYHQSSYDVVLVSLDSLQESQHLRHFALHSHTREP